MIQNILRVYVKSDGTQKSFTESTRNYFEVYETLFIRQIILASRIYSKKEIYFIKIILLILFDGMLFL